MSYFTDNFDDKIVSLLKSGAVGFMPTDTIYGLSALALDRLAVERVYEIKSRDKNKPFIILLADAAQAQELGLAQADLEEAQRYWPAKLTLICPAGEKTPHYLHRGMNSLAVRIPDSPELLKLIARTGPLISTSANIQDDSTLSSLEQAKKYFKDKLDFYVDGGMLSGLPSTICVPEGEQLKVIRQGAFHLS